MRDVARMHKSGRCRVEQTRSSRHQTNFGQKKARSNRFGLNPPKKEGGGDSVRLRQTGKLVNQPDRAEHCRRSWTEPAAHRVTVEATFDERIIGIVFVRRKISVHERTEMLHNCLPVENPIRIIDLGIKTPAETTQFWL